MSKHPRRRRGRRGRKKKAPTLAVSVAPAVQPLPAAPLPDIRTRLAAINALRRAPHGQ